MYEPGELHVVAYRDGEEWAEATVQTTGEAAGLEASADRDEIRGDGYDLSFITKKSYGRKQPYLPNSQ